MPLKLKNSCVQNQSFIMSFFLPSSVVYSQYKHLKRAKGLLGGKPTQAHPPFVWLFKFFFFIYCYWKRVMFMINISNPSMKGILLRYISCVLHLWYICSVQRNNSNTPLAKRSPEVEDVQENRSKTQEPFTTQNHEMTCFLPGPCASFLLTKSWFAH